MEWLVAMLKEGCQADAAGPLRGSFKLEPLQVTQAILGQGDPDTGASLSASMCMLILRGLPAPVEDGI